MKNAQLFKILFLAFILFTIKANSFESDEKKQSIDIHNQNEADEFINSNPYPLTLECQIHIKQIQNRFTYNWIEIEKVRVFYYYPKKSLLINPTIFFNGGPGSTSYTVYKKLIEKSLNKVDFIFMDQPGTGCSSFYPLGINTETIYELEKYTSNAIVEFAEAIRVKLIGNKTWNVFGQSFGGHIVYRYIELHPEGINKAVVHGNAVGISSLERNYLRILSQRKIMEKYLDKYPSDRKRIEILLKSLNNKNLCLVSANELSVCGMDLIAFFLSDLSYPDNWVYLTSNMRNLIQNDSLDIELFKHKFKKYNFVANRNNIDSKQIILPDYNYARNYLGIVDWDSQVFDFELCTSIYKKIKQTNYKNTFSFDECSGAMQFGFKDEVSSLIKTKMAEINKKTAFIKLDTLKNMIRKYNLSVYVFSGDLDCLVPKEIFTKQNKYLSKEIHYQNFKASGHEGFYTESEVIRVLF